jgi:alpha-galactosidase
MFFAGDWDYVTVTNREVIAVDQDALGKQGARISGGDMHGPSGDTKNVWARQLSDGTWAAVFVNNANVTADVVCDTKCFAQMFPRKAHERRVIIVRDLWQHKIVGTTSTYSWTAKRVPGFGASVMYRFV